MIWFVGAGSGAPDLITVRGMRLLQTADVIIYTGSLVDPNLLNYARPDASCLDSSKMTLEEVLAVMTQAEKENKTTVRLHTGDPGLYSTIGEQTAALDALDIKWGVVPGVSSFSAAAAALGAEFTLPGVSQSLVITRMEGRTPVPETEKIRVWARHGASMAIFLSAGLLSELTQELLDGGMAPDTPAAIIFKASWPDEKIIRCTIGSLASEGSRAGIQKTAMILIGRFLDKKGNRSCLYDPTFSTGCRKAGNAD